MAFINVLVPLATFFVMAYSSEIGLFYFASAFLPYTDLQEFESAWEICPDNTTDQAKYKEVLDVARSCYNNVTKGNESICRALEDRVERCSEPLVEFFVDCFPDKSKDLPSAIAKAATSVVETFCTSSGELLLEAFNPCMLDAFQSKNETKEECSKEFIIAKLEKFDVELPSKEEACKAFQEVGGCWKEYVNDNCGSLASKFFFLKFYNAALVGCK